MSIKYFPDFQLSHTPLRNRKCLDISADSKSFPTVSQTTSDNIEEEDMFEDVFTVEINRKDGVEDLYKSSVDDTSVQDVEWNEALPRECRLTSFGIVRQNSVVQQCEEGKYQNKD